jgi:hypothetical protein
MDIPMSINTAARCANCFRQTPTGSNSCEHCGGEIQTGKPQSVLGKIKRALGIEISSDIVAINLEDDGYFFTAQEIESLLRMESAVVLDLEDVPDYDTMFYKSKRVHKPLDRTPR